jgi:peptidyl-prolyl cis-trans isomerase-like protein 2
MNTKLTGSDSCALSLQPFKAPVAVLADVVEGETPRADVFDLLNIVPYIRKFKTSKSPYMARGMKSSCIDPVSGKPLDTSQLIKLNFFKVCRHFLSLTKEG